MDENDLQPYKDELVESLNDLFIASTMITYELQIFISFMWNMDPKIA